MNVITWNMQGGTASGESKWISNVQGLFKKHGYHVACLQESGSWPPGEEKRGSWLTGFAPPNNVTTAYCKWDVGGKVSLCIYIVWIKTDPNGNRNNVAVASLEEPLHLIYIPNPLGGRAAVGMYFRHGAGKRGIFSLHAFSGNGNDGPGLLANIDNANRVLESYEHIKCSWFAAGDYNCDPTEWGVPGSESPKIMPPNTVYCPHDNVATYPSTNKNLDYAFKSPDPSVIGKVQQKLNWSDHYPVSYKI